MNALIDTNTALDVLLEREPHLTDIFYIARKAAGRDRAQEAVELCLTTFAVCPLDGAILRQALLLPGRDFEDNVQIAAAMQAGLDAIVTRNPADFAPVALPVLTPAAFLARISA